MKAYDSALHMMECSGGSFAQSLAACYRRADMEYKRRLKAAFPEIFEFYDRQYERHLGIVAERNRRAA